MLTASAKEIVQKLEAEQLTARDAAMRTAPTAADFLRIRQVKLKRPNVDLVP